MPQPQASSLLLEHTKLVSATGPLHLLFPQLESLLPRFSGCWHPPLPTGLSSNVTSFVRSSPIHLSLFTPALPHPYPKNSLLHLLHPSKISILKRDVFCLCYIYYLMLSLWEQEPVSLDLKHFACPWFSAQWIRQKVLFRDPQVFYVCFFLKNFQELCTPCIFLLKVWNLFFVSLNSCSLNFPVIINVDILEHNFTSYF